MKVGKNIIGQKSKLAFTVGCEDIRTEGGEDGHPDNSGVGNESSCCKSLHRNASAVKYYNKI